MRIAILVLVSLLFASPVEAGAKPVLRVSGPAIAESIPLMVMAETERTWVQDFDVQFIPWHSPDMLRAMVAGKQVDAAIVTTAAACALKSRGIKCRVALLHESPVWIVSTRSGPDTLESLEGTLLFPFGPGQMPELFYRAALAEKNDSITTRYTGGTLEAVNLLLAGKGDHAMLSEPTASIAIFRSRIMQQKGVPLLIKRVDMRQAWKRAFPGHRLAASGIAFFGEKSDRPEEMRAFSQAYRRAYQWVRNNPEKALQLSREKYPGLSVHLAQAQGMDFSDSRILTGKKAQDDALFYLGKIHEISPATIGGSMPDSDFFEVGQ